MTTLANVRARLNNELGVLTDAETQPWSQAQRNQAIGDAYAALWGKGVQKFTTQDIAVVEDKQTYDTTIRRLYTVEVIDSDGMIVGHPSAAIIPSASSYTLQLRAPVTTGVTIRVYGFTPYKSTFSGDSDTDDIDATIARVPILKATSICYRMGVAWFARWSDHQAQPAAMNVTPDQLMQLRAGVEREWEIECSRISKEAPRISQARLGRPL